MAVLLFHYGGTLMSNKKWLKDEVKKWVKEDIITPRNRKYHIISLS